MKTIRIENSGHEPQIINVPEGAKVIIEDGLTMVEPEKYVPKTGDCVKIVSKDFSQDIVFVAHNVHGTIYEGGSYINHYGQICEKTNIAFSSSEWIQITPDELQSEFNKLGYEYDFCQHEARKLRWKPEECEKYYCVQGDGIIIHTYFNNYPIDISRYEIGNCYRTAEEAEPRRQHYLSFKD